MHLRMRTKSVVVLLVIIMTMSIFSGSVFADTGWKCDSNGWWYSTGDSYYKNQWAEIDGEWYYFDAKGYMERDCYRGGYWLKSNGAWDKNYSHGKWKSDEKGWWYEDNGWYPRNKWLQIDGQRYYFDSKGYMEHECYRNGCWLKKNGACDKNHMQAAWKKDDKGWWFSDNGWYPKFQWLWIDGKKYFFDNDGYMESGCYRFGYWLTDSGAWDGRTTVAKWLYDSNGQWYDDNGWIPKSCLLKVDGVLYWFDDSGYSHYPGRNPRIPDDATKYSYEIIPLTGGLRTAVYIKTDNPDPDSFRFIDPSSKYSDASSAYPLITVEKERYVDVVYEDSSKYRVKGGYIAFPYANVDGGEMILQTLYIAGCDHYGIYYDFKNTDVTVQMPELYDDVDYLIETYGDPKKSFFDNMDAIQDGLSDICLYSGVVVRGEFMKAQARIYEGSEYTEGECFCGLSTSPHTDQTFYLRSPYARVEGKRMLLNSLYPYRLDSLGFPSMMAAVAQRLDPGATYQWDWYYHNTIHVTCNGETREYGGQGHGGGQMIDKENIRYYFKFDGSADDAVNRTSFKTLSDDIKYYGTLDIKPDLVDDGIKWQDVRSAVGTGGSYVRLNTAMSSTYEAEYDSERNKHYTACYMDVGRAFTFLYDNGSTFEETNIFTIGYFSNVWYDGRYFNYQEIIYPGATFEDSYASLQPTLVFKDCVIRIPDNDKYTYIGDKLSDCGYDAKSKVWSGFTEYRFDEATNTWKNLLIDWICYYDSNLNQYVYLKDDPTYGPAFVDDCTITVEEALAMHLDANTNVDPSEYYVFDMTEEPGTYHKDN